jgi:hypothetical protein
MWLDYQFSLSDCHEHRRETRTQLAEQIRRLETSSEARFDIVTTQTEARFEAVGRNLRAVEADNAAEKNKVCIWDCVCVRER